MSKKNGWVGIDKMVAQVLTHINRPFSLVEAMVSFSIDIDNNKSWTINGYAKQWGWSRNKVRIFTKECRTPTGHQRDTNGTHLGHPVCWINKALWRAQDTNGTPTGHQRDTNGDATNNPNPNPNKNIVFERVLFYLNKKAKKQFKSTESNLGLIKSRMAEGFTESDFTAAIDNQVAAWGGDPEWEKYLRPATLFSKSKFDGYVNNTPKGRGVKKGGYTFE